MSAEMEKRFLQMLQACRDRERSKQDGGEGKPNNGVSTTALQQEFGDDLSPLEKFINDMLVQRRVQLARGTDGVLWYKLLDEETSTKLQDLSKEQQTVYQQISNAGDRGIWVRDIKNNSGIQQQTITKALKVLEGRGLIKSLHGVHSKTKKLYILAGLSPSNALMDSGYYTDKTSPSDELTGGVWYTETPRPYSRRETPSDELTGGVWYTDNEFDHAFIDSLRSFVTTVVRENRLQGTTLEAITAQVRTSGISTVELTAGQIDTIVRCLVHDRIIEEIRGTGNGSDGVLFRASKDADSMPDAFLTEFPCGVCPVIDHCAEGAVISPQTCVYLARWLEMPGTDDYQRPCLKAEDLF
ncbi:RNA polymerase Rpc34 subunit-domain-containing protein [Tribonema minus]|uniref:DNA-directed RNA polymerase III subunit RPC6 n=1 Tax=Tribonema minus TaxID=303371 RepID=A0A835YTE4_9STRA|nr:RNA polymerase Rpc34 subunit-domain-containing protein [Tribonema minus]